MLGQDSLRDAVRAAGIDVSPVYFPELPSTSSEALRLAAEGAPEWTVVATDHQTRGRGRLGRTWTTPRGKALTFSVVLRPPLPADRAAVATLLAAVEMARACRDAAGAEVVAKWPNDLVVGERKVAGLLGEANVAGGSLRHLVLGVGVNLTMAPEDFPDDVRPTATSLALEGGAPEADEVLRGFLRSFRDRYRPGDPGFPSEVRARYRAVCATLGRRVRAATPSGSVEGTAADVEEDGALAVETDRGRERVAFGEVVHLSPGG